MGILKRLFKGKDPKSIDYIIFDLETTGLNPRTAEIIEIAAIKIRDGVISETFHSFAKPKFGIKERAFKINGITAEMLESAEDITDVLPQFAHFIGNSKLIGYNIASYDLPLLRRFAEESNIEFLNEYLDVYPMAVDRVPNLPNNKLTTIASYLLVDTNSAHRAINDCIMTKECYEKLLGMPIVKRHSKGKKQYRANYSDQTKALQHLQAILIGIVNDGKITTEEVEYLNQWLINNEELCGNYPYDRVAIVVRDVLEDQKIESEELEEMLVMFNEFIAPQTATSVVLDQFNLDGKNIVLSGDFDFGTKNDIANLIQDNGGIIKSGVSGKTDYVIVGAKGSADWSCGNYGTKIKRAMELQDAGKDIAIITESDLFSLIN